MSVKYPCTPYLLLHVLLWSQLKLCWCPVWSKRVEQQHVQESCMVVFTCTVTQGLLHNWASSVFTCDNSPSPTFVFTASTSVGDTVSCSSFQANLTSFSAVSASRANFPSTLTPTTPTSPGTVVTCSDPGGSQQQSKPYPSITGKYYYL